MIQEEWILHSFRETKTASGEESLRKISLKIVPLFKLLYSTVLLILKAENASASALMWAYSLTAQVTNFTKKIRHEGTPTHSRAFLGSSDFSKSSCLPDGDRHIQKANFSLPVRDAVVTPRKTLNI